MNLTTPGVLPGDTCGAPVATRDGSFTLRHPEHGECYHSLAGAFFEARELYVTATGFKAALSSPSAMPLCVLDVGLGLGYNALATIEAWQNEPHIERNLVMASLEINPELVERFVSGATEWQDDWPEAWRAWARALSRSESEIESSQESATIWRARIAHRENPSLQCEWVVHVGDAARVPMPVPAPGLTWDYIWQDPFSPKKNPILWDATWFARVRDVASEKATIATYSVARAVKDALSATGWQYELIPAPGSKRNWLLAHRLSR